MTGSSAVTNGKKPTAPKKSVASKKSTTPKRAATPKKTVAPVKTISPLKTTAPEKAAPKKPRVKKPQSEATKIKRESASDKRRHYLPAEERRRLILKAAKEVFARSGLKGSRTRDLAQAAGINQATLFGHFESKEDLFTAAILQPLVELLEGVRERYQAYEAADSPTSLSKLINTGMQKHLENMIEIYPLLIQALFSDQTLGKKLYREQIQPMIKARTGLVRNVIKDTIDPDLVELASFGMFFAIAMDRVMTGKTGDLADISQQLSDLILFGCSRQPWDN